MTADRVPLRAPMCRLRYDGAGVSWVTVLPYAVSILEGSVIRSDVSLVTLRFRRLAAI